MAVLSQIVAALAGEAGEPDRLAIDPKPFRTAFAGRGIAGCIPPKENPTQPIPCDKTLHRIETALGRQAGATSQPAPTAAHPSSPAPSHAPPSSSSGADDES